jgi:glyoxylase-like metal-dependent hydrolase (beta-lactamase superfamily II)
LNINLNTFTSFTTSNCYVLQPFGDDVCIFIDLPPDLQDAIKYVKENNLSIGGALITHGHYDHALGLKDFNYSSYINLDDEFLARNPQEQIKYFMGSSEGIDSYNGELKYLKDIPYKNIKHYKNPGHTKGSTSFEFPELGLIFTGDFVFRDGIGRTDLHSGSLIEMKASLKNVFMNFNEDFEILPGHGPSGKVKSIKSNNITIKEFLND